MRRVTRIAACGLLAITLHLPGPSTSPGSAQERDGVRTFELTTATIEGINAAFDAGALTAVRLVELYLARIGAYDARGPRLNAIITLSPDALRLAAELDGERARSGPRSPVHGIPVLVKDNYNTFDMPTAAASVALEGSIPPGDAFTVRQLRDAGAIILGKVNMSEFASPAGWGSYSSLNGITLNPYDLRRTPAGSSGGTGAAIAAAFAAVGLGTDTGGSIRGPAAANGLAGIRATYGLLSRSGIVPQALSLDVPGPMARSVTDVAVALGIMAVSDPDDPTTLGGDRTSYDDYAQFLDEEALRGARIGVARDFFGGNPEVDLLMEASIRAMRESGATIVDPVGFEEEFLDLIERNGSGIRSRINAEFQPGLENYLTTLGEGYPRTLAEVIAIYESPQVVHIGAPRESGPHRPPQAEPRDRRLRRPRLRPGDRERSPPGQADRARDPGQAPAGCARIPHLKVSRGPDPYGRRGSRPRLRPRAVGHQPLELLRLPRRPGTGRFHLRRPSRNHLVPRPGVLGTRAPRLRLRLRAVHRPLAPLAARAPAPGEVFEY